MRFAEPLGGVWTGLGNLADEAHDLAAAKDYFQRNVEVQQSLAPSNKIKVKARLASAYRSLGKCNYALKDRAAAADDFSKAADIWEALTVRVPQDHGYRNDLCEVYGLLATLSIDGSSADEIQRVFSRQIPVLEGLRKSDPSDRLVSQKLALGYSSLAEASFKAHDTKAALENYLKFAPIAEADYKAAPSDAERLNTLWFLYRRIGTIYRTDRQLPQATVYFEKFLAMSRAWAELDPENPKPMFAVAEAYLHMGTVKELAEDYRAATDTYEQGLAVTKSVDEKWKYQNPGYLEVRNTLRQHAETCRKNIPGAPATQP